MKTLCPALRVRPGLWAGLCLLAAASGCASSVRRLSSVSAVCSEDVSFGLDHANGSIEISGSGGPGFCAVDYEILTRAGSLERATALADAVEIQLVSGQNGRLDLQAHRPATLGMENITINYKVKLASHARIAVTSHNGSLHVEGFSGAIEATLHNGSARLRAVNGPVDIESHNGSIRIDLAAENREPQVKVESSNGSIGMALPPEYSATIHAKLSNGSLHAAPSAGMQLMRIRAGEFRGAMREGRGSIELISRNGSVSLH